MDPLKIVTNQSVAFTGTSAAITNAFGAGVTVIRVVSTTDCFIKFGSAPTATTSDMPLIANVVEYFGASPGVKIAAIQKASAGTLYVTEMCK